VVLFCGRVTDGEQKYGRINEATPAKWQQDYKDFHAPIDVLGTTPQNDAQSAPPVTHTNIFKEETESKKRKHEHEDEIGEVRAEKKQKKKDKKGGKEKKEKKEKKGKEKSTKAEDGVESE
jgi:H/ACA ribonucleoprotein complex subunit 4